MSLSIHDLTRRSTIRGTLSRFPNSTFNSRPHKEVDLAPYWRRRPIQAFNSRPHKEVDKNSLVFLLRIRSFNSRPHKEVDAVGDLKKQIKAFFQFTTSQGGRRCGCNNNCGCGCSFNSRPHKEVDKRRIITEVLHQSFNSRPHKEVDDIHSHLKEQDDTFNSRPHKEVDVLYQHNGTNKKSFQFTTSQGGRLLFRPLHRNQ